MIHSNTLYTTMIHCTMILQDAMRVSADCNLPAPLPMNRFRPNIVIAGCEPYAEDTWPALRIGLVDFAAAKACVRCIVTTTDQLTTERGEEPLEFGAERRVLRTRSFEERRPFLGGQFERCCKEPVQFRPASEWVFGQAHVAPFRQAIVGSRPRGAAVRPAPSDDARTGIAGCQAPALPRDGPRPGLSQSQIERREH